MVLLSRNFPSRIEQCKYCKPEDELNCAQLPKISNEHVGYVEGRSNYLATLSLICISCVKQQLAYYINGILDKGCTSGVNL